MSESSTKLGKIFIGGLSYETTDDKLRMYFSTFGPVTDAVVMKDPISRRSRGFGFITYADPVCVDRALAQPNHILDNRRVEAKRAVPRAESTRDSISSTTSSRNGSIISTTSISSNVGSIKKIFVGGLHYETKDAEFRRYFQQYGKVVSAEVMFNRETSKSRGFGFVIFESELSVEHVLQDNSHVIDGKSVEVKRAVPRTDIPPPRSVSSRAGSFTGPPGPGSVGSLDDVSVTSTASVSRSGTPCSSLSASGTGFNDSNRYGGSSSANSNSTLSGYAAAVRYGGRGHMRTNSIQQPSPRRELPRGRDNPEQTLAQVADALTSLVLRDDTPPLAPRSTGSSLESDEKPLDSPVAPRLSPLGIVPASLADTSIDQWNLSPPARPQAAGEVPTLTPVHSQMAWKTRPWQKGWASQAEREDYDSRPTTRNVHHDTMGAPPYFSAFGGGSDDRRSNSSIGQASWSSPTFTASSPASGSEFGGALGMGGDVLGGHSVFNGSGGVGNGAFSSGGLGIHTRSSYNSLGGYLQPEYLAPRAEPELPLERALGGMMDDLNASDDDFPRRYG